ncbi:hypothetical protein EMIHUDRAFT_229442 [Emiliania huxleyi CCMP1516]|uniref:UBX domain-containing protein n=2 Tax=Emiliania huxleyi TaxID=2903 RepID=A0A0D3JRB6_EMIH1|nr:hypothetical protein EMIHUDRAFT_237203 [Emiliania huxleyi CCMP1516]XP_005786128.1 hypothetical protein EMIHUDRAFT_229442 [Emiliania huxleyi CCMP1516]EOD26051.1 hypothetical protein EMIHUDRAFT_237203 [Emiliania huxleyi CCMP1516]EOD33699.1 hypothetical protein EMIHUDRAFT_229442 [Emiliania huxleyi CCMP1516]|eukprot:XP_005778480.1 hypothetical protein EMIHUDRAFT_237203 [Emiliania huxleyi CCMP1516]
MELDLDRAARRFAKDTSARAKEAASKREKLRAEREATRAIAARREAAKAAEEAAAAAAAAVEAEHRAADLERNRGVYYSEQLRPILSRAAEERGIVRRCDKAQLPPSAAASLSDASHNGVAAFEISVPATGAATHATLLDFGAPEGAIGLPEPLLRGSFARFQPVEQRFRLEVEDVKALLESELMRRTTLSVGDTILPEPAVSLIDTDLEADTSLLPLLSAGGVLLSIRCPDGSRCVRRLEPDAPLEAAFLLAEAGWVEQPGTAPLPPAFKLAAQFPRRVFARDGAAAVSLAAAGLGGAQEALLIELPSE